MENGCRWGERRAQEGRCWRESGMITVVMMAEWVGWDRDSWYDGCRISDDGVV